MPPLQDYQSDLPLFHGLTPVDAHGYIMPPLRGLVTQ